MNSFLPALGRLALGAAVAAAAAPALAQDYEDEEITVVGTYERIPDEVESLSQAVSYADLDLGTEEGWDAFRDRIRLTARYLCDRLGEPRFASPPTRSCRSAAERDALRRFGTDAQYRAPRGTAWVGEPALEPYRGDWEE